MYDQATRTTYYYERIRALAAGITETASTTFLLLIAVRWFEAGPTYKALIAGASSFGYFLAPFAVHFVERQKAGITRSAAAIFAFSAFCYLIAAIVPNLHVYAIASVFAVSAASMTIPLVIQMYQENYPPSRRGQLLSGSVMIKIAVAAIFSDLAGRALNGRLEYYQVLMLIFFLASAFGSYCLSRCPGEAIVPQANTKPLRGLAYVRTDAVFRNTLISWMLLGFANLMMLPLRVEYLANPAYGLDLSVSDIALLVGVIPNAARFVLSPVWGRLFDRMNFFVLRMTLNMGFMIGIVTFFTSTSFLGLTIGAVTFGIANAGGDIAWSLWVTKFAPPERVADYMAVHSFFTGVRGIIAPFAAFQLLLYISPQSLGIFSGMLIVCATVLLIPQVKMENARTKSKEQSS